MRAWDIEFSDLRAGYGDHVVLDGINAVLPGGRISVILGGSGCGKSTLLRQIIGLSRPLAGRVLVGGQDLFALPGSGFRRLRRRMGVLFQDGALLGALTLADNVALPLSEHLSLPRRLLREAAMRCLDMVGLAEFADYYPNQLSGGMRKRAGLARAIIAEPGILLCDEPTSGLDPITAARMDELLLSMHRQYAEMTIVVVSHDLASLDRIADHVLMLGNGSALFCGDMAGLRESSDPYIIDFLQRRADAATGNDAYRPLPEEVRKAMESWLTS